MLFSLLLLQAAAQQPDIEIDASIRARSLKIEKKGEASLTIRTSPDGGNVVDVRAPEANGRRTLRNIEASVHADANIADPRQIQLDVETPQPE